MSKSTLDIYGTLSPEQLQFANSKLIDATMKMKRWFDFMVPIAQMDKLNDESRRKKRTIIGWTIFGMVISLVFTFVFLPVILILIGFTVILIVNVSKLNTLKRMDIGNHLRLFLIPFLVVMKEECDDNAKGHIKFDASNPINPKKIINTTKTNPNGSGLPEVTTTFYHHPWLNTEFIMADGTALQLEFTDNIQKKNIKKRGSSGKIKYKSKIKIKHRLEMKLSFKKDKYSLSEINKAYEYSEDGENHLFKLKNRLESYSTEQSIPVQEVLSMMAGAYQNVKPLN
jgi:hypothetical protein